MNPTRALALSLLVVGLLLLARLTTRGEVIPGTTGTSPAAVVTSTLGTPPQAITAALATLPPLPGVSATAMAPEQPEPSPSPRSAATTAASAIVASAVSPTLPAASPTLPATASATHTPAVTLASPTNLARIVNNAVEPSWWPCAQGDIKGLLKLGWYYPPDHPGYNQTYVGVTCFPNPQAAVAAGLSEAPR